MVESRIIPVLGIVGTGLYKTKQFTSPRYVGDPINAVRVFNEKEVNELFISCFRCTTDHQPIPFKLLKEIAGEAFFPLGYGGGLNNVSDCAKIISYGYEKVCLNTAAFNTPNIVSEIAKELGNSSVVISLDIRKNTESGHYMVYTESGTKNTGLTLEQAANQAVNSGAGELIINDIDRDGTFSGYNFEAIKSLINHISVPLIILGGASSISDLKEAQQLGIQGIAASSIFVFYGKLKAVLINYPEKIFEE